MASRAPDCAVDPSREWCAAPRRSASRRHARGRRGRGSSTGARARNRKRRTNRARENISWASCILPSLRCRGDECGPGSSDLEIHDLPALAFDLRFAEPEWTWPRNNPDRIKFLRQFLPATTLRSVEDLARQPSNSAANAESGFSRDIKIKNDEVTRNAERPVEIPVRSNTEI